VLVSAVTTALDNAKSEVIIVTPYMIPGDGGMGFINELTGRGVRVVVFTNSLASTNHVAVHGGYSRYRKPLLRAGVELYEARANAGSETGEDGQEGIDALTLHTKGILIDRKIAFVGSLNIDPRSVDINTEMGVFIESEALAERLSERVDTVLVEISYKVELDEYDHLIWRATIDGEEVIETTEPLSSRWRRFKAFMSKILPERQL
jgi:putative cardiolipin synthase